ncbi:RNA polymerase sigma factor [Panacagrimonas sp.]|uniref:RNA polymerase sigma factor n=1 Tax=Panacagrimonas sp. TaxID=2480088 RepID=UPI003B51A3C4
MAEPLRGPKGGAAYKRRPDAEAQIDTLLQLPAGEIARRARDEGFKSPEFVTTEAVLYFIRQKRTDSNPLAMMSLYETLRHRIRSLHRGARRTAGRLTLEEVEERLLYRFEELLSLDRQGYEEGLDWFECNFNSGLYTLRINAIRDVKRKMPEGLEALEAEGQTEVSPMVEEALARLAGQSPEDERENEYRSRLLEVIRELPEELKRVIEMHDLRGMPMDSKLPGVTSVASVLGIGEQTVRKRRKRALLEIQKGFLREE